MKALRVVAAVCILVLAAAALAAAGPAKAKPAKPLKIKVHAPGQAFCPSAVLVFGSIVIASGRCYTVYVLRDARGTFLAFAAADARIPPGQLVRLNTPAGAKLRGRIFYLVPLRTAAVIVPMDTMTLVAFRTEDFGSSLTFILTGANASLVFSVRY
ncbi:MAG: hypothetical protein QN141_02590 [Armatimonadota bacterium]|nr:hypothetical protein [Armatimonadota bacterium]MDR7450788.1 hypothetical protein [Armatimonadota bacterium]MDR7466144.1 hypothetical protein [Armatimonadota bacterium]MDR7493819.1 hypothetical protein [Armatimonadota bacterium]MDR7499020.1 hypothetical protein [Armatimonadota bacterium]